MRILFMGTPHIAKTILESIASQYAITSIFTRPDKPSGRGQQYQYSPVKEYALHHAIPLYQPKSLRSQEVYKHIVEIAPDLIIVVAYGVILPEEILAIPRYGAINVHASLLPAYRGAAPIQRALWNNEKESGITIMKMDAGLDTGDILLTSSFPIQHTDTTYTLMESMAHYGTRALLEVLTYYHICFEYELISDREITNIAHTRFTRKTTDSIENYVLHPKKQDNSLASFAEKITKHDLSIQWNKAVEHVHAQIAAVTSSNSPSASSILLRENTQPLHLRIMIGTFATSTQHALTHTIGQLFFLNNALYVQCNPGHYQLLSIRPESKKSITAKDFYFGYIKGGNATFSLSP
ncbi:MAG: methionyl-tRNA formyltransferase [Desulfovibrionaceae bacterium]